MKLHLKIEERASTTCFVMSTTDHVLSCRLETTPEEATKIRKYSLDDIQLTILPHNNPDMKTPTLFVSMILNRDFQRNFNRADQAVIAQADIVAGCKALKEQLESFPDDHTGSGTIDL